MTTVQEFIAVKLAVTFGLSFEEAGQIVAAEVEGWRIARINFGWGKDITQASERVKAQAWYSAQAQYQQIQKEKDHDRKTNV